MKTKRWRAGFHMKYYMITEFNKVSYSVDVRAELDNRRYISGNYYQTQQEAKNVLQLRNTALEMLEQLQSIVDGTGFDSETGFIWGHRLAAIEKVTKKAIE